MWFFTQQTYLCLINWMLCTMLQNLFRWCAQVVAVWRGMSELPTSTVVMAHKWYETTGCHLLFGPPEQLIKTQYFDSVFGQQFQQPVNLIMYDAPCACSKENSEMQTNQHDERWSHGQYTSLTRFSDLHGIWGAVLWSRKWEKKRKQWRKEVRIKRKGHRWI